MESKRVIFIDNLHKTFVQDPTQCQLDCRLLAAPRAKLWSGTGQTMCDYTQPWGAHCDLGPGMDVSRHHRESYSQKSQEEKKL